MKTDHFSNLTNEEIMRLIDSWIRGRNAERNRKILKLRLIDGMTFEKLAEEMDMSVRQIKNIIYDGEYTIFSKIK